MSDKPSVLLRVKDLKESVAFYRDSLRFDERWVDESDDVAHLVSPTGRSLLLAGPGAENTARFLAPVYDRPKAGGTIYVEGGPDLLNYRDMVLERLPDRAKWEKKEWGELVLKVEDPDGYVVAFWGNRPLSDEEILHYYRLAPERLEEALSGLEESALDLARAPGKWTIRQLVLHMVDSDATSLGRIKFSLAEPGRRFAINSYDPDVWAEGLDYANRPIDAEVVLFRAIRSHIAGLLEHLPGAWDRSVTDDRGQAVPVRQLVNMLTMHALHHIEQIRETRRIHGV